MFSISKKIAAIILLTGFVLAGCGQKGPLYHPDPEQEARADK